MTILHAALAMTAFTFVSLAALVSVVVAFFSVASILARIAAYRHRHLH